MSQENVEIVERLYRAFQDEGLDAVIEFFDPEIVWEDLGLLPGAGTYHGHEGVRESVARFYDVWGALTIAGEEFIDAGDTVVVAHRWRGEGKASGTPIDTLVWNVLTLRDGKIVHRRAYQERADALEAAGLSG